MKSNLQHPVAVLGLPLNSLSTDTAIDAIERLVLSGGTHQVATANLGFWCSSVMDRHLHRIIAGCSLVLADSAPLVWASRALGAPLPERMSRVGLASGLADLSARQEYRIFLLGGNQGIAERAASVLRQHHPGARIVGTFTPQEQSLTRMDHSEILKRIHEAQPDILMVDFGYSRQEKWIWMHRKRLGVPVTIGVGGAFESLAGEARRALHWIERCGLAWALRCARQPLRVLRNFAGLAQRLPMALSAACLQEPFFGRTKVTSMNTPQTMHVHIDGKLDADTGSELQRAITASIIHELTMVVHLESVRYITPAGLGALLSARRQLLDGGLTLQLAGLNLRRRFQLRAWCVDRLFDEWRPAPARDKAAISRIDIEANIMARRERSNPQPRPRTRG